MSAAKADILARIRGALGPSPTVPDIPRAYRAAGSITSNGIVDLFCERVAEYRATVHRGVPSRARPHPARAAGSASPTASPTSGSR